MLHQLLQQKLPEEEQGDRRQHVPHKEPHLQESIFMKTLLRGNI